MLNKLPTEMWLYTFKYMNVEDLFKKRRVCKYFKSIIDNNLKYFYNNFSRLYPKYFCKINNQISSSNFIKGFLNIYIEKNFENCTLFILINFKIQILLFIN